MALKSNPIMANWAIGTTLSNSWLKSKGRSQPSIEMTIKEISQITEQKETMLEDCSTVK